MNLLETTQSNITELERLASQTAHVIDQISEPERTSFVQYVQIISGKAADRKKVKFLKSIEAKKPVSQFPPDPSRYVHNFSSVQLNQLQLEALSLGPKFCAKQPYCSQIELESQFENLMSQCHDLLPTSSVALANLKSSLVHHCQQYLRCKPMKCALTKKHRDAVKELKDNPHLIMSRPDKGAGWVLLDRESYITKMNEILSDASKFQHLPKEGDKTERNENMIVRKRLSSSAEAIAIRILKPCLCKQKDYVQPLLLPWPS